MITAVFWSMEQGLSATLLRRLSITNSPLNMGMETDN
jgi:hypothetical protein